MELGSIFITFLISIRVRITFMLTKNIRIVSLFSALVFLYTYIKKLLEPGHLSHLAFILNEVLRNNNFNLVFIIFNFIFYIFSLCWNLWVLICLSWKSMLLLRREPTMQLIVWYLNHLSLYFQFLLDVKLITYFLSVTRSKSFSFKI